MKKLVSFLLLSVCCSVQANIPAWTAGNDLNIEGRAATFGFYATGKAEKTSHSSSQTKTAGVTASIGASSSVGATASQSKNDAESHTLTHANSQISAGNLNSDSKSFTLAGANVEITHDINLNTQHLTVESVQNTHQSSKGSSQSVGVTPQVAAALTPAVRVTARTAAAKTANG